MESPIPSDLLSEESEETIPLSEILALRDACLQEEELWALCRECCLLLEYVQDSEEMFQAVSITPETTGFDCQGNLCFLYLESTEPEPLFLPPELDDATEKSLSAHLYSLGMTMLYAAEYNVQTTSPRERSKMSGDFSRLVGRMTADSPPDRPAVGAVLTECDKMLGCECSQEICADIATSCRQKSSQEDGHPKVSGPSLAEINSHLEQGHVNGVPLHVWSNLDDSQGHDSDSELAHAFPDHHNNNNNNKESVSSDKGLVDANLTQDGILYSSSDDNNGYQLITTNGHHELAGDGGLLIHENYIDDTPVVSQDVNDVLDNEVFHNSGNEIGGESLEYLLERHTDSSVGLVENYSPSITGGSSFYDNVIPPQESYTEGDLTSASTYNGDIAEFVGGVGHFPHLQFEGEESPVEVIELSEEDRLYLWQTHDTMDNKRKMTQSQGVTLTEVLEKRTEYFQEAELWAVCREGIKALQKLKKRLPAYISPDTMIIREEGFVSFKAIPEDKPLEVIFMAPELQQKGLLSEKTCLYGLAVTLRCGAGKKFSASPSLSLSKEMEALLHSMLNSDLDKRPSLTDVLTVCDDHEQLSEVPSNAICQFMFQDTATAMMESEAILEMSLTGVQTRAALQQAELMATTELNMLAQNSQLTASDTAEDARVVSHDANSSGVTGTPEMASPKTTSAKSAPVSAFKPVALGPSSSPQRGLKRVPSKYNSTATHFTPIVLQHSNAASAAPQQPTNKRKEVERKTAGSDRDHKETTDVVKKLKELKENLMKNRSNGQSKENEGNADRGSVTKKSPADSTPVQPVSVKAQKPQRPDKADGVDENSSGKNPNQVSLEMIAQLLQNQGQLAQLSMLAATIAQLLQNGGNSSLGNPNSQGQTKSQQQGSAFTQTRAASDPSQQHVAAGAGVMRLPSLDIPQQFQDQLVGQTVTMPIQLGGGMVANYPVQLQLQQDPRTGLIQLVPMGVVPVQGRGNGTLSAASSRASNQPASSPHPQGHLSSSNLRSSGRSARGLVQKCRSKEGTRDGAQCTVVRRDSSLRRAQSEHNLAPEPVNSDTGTVDHPGKHRSSSIPNLINDSNGLNVSAPYILPVYDDGYVYNNSPNWQYDQRSHRRYREHHHTENIVKVRANRSHNEHVLNSRRHSNVPVPNVPRGGGEPVSPGNSHSSSPSPSKDSGVSGLNSGGGAPRTRGYSHYPQTDVSLMERLLGHDSLKQQQVLQTVVKQLREAFSYEAYLEAGGEDYVMAEYITSLASLKWETFKSAIEEKYPDFMWVQDVLCQLFDTVNSKIIISKQSSLGPEDEASMLREDTHQLDMSQPRHLSASTPRSQSATEPVKPTLTLARSEGKMSTSSAETGQSETKSDTALREPCYRYSPPPRSGLHRFNPSRNLCNAGEDGTSDSTDTSENHERKRHYRKRHQLNRSKNSSHHSSSNTPVDESHLSYRLDNEQESVNSRPPSGRTRDIAIPNNSTIALNNSAASRVPCVESPVLPRLSETSSSEWPTRVAPFPNVTMVRGLHCEDDEEEDSDIDNNDASHHFTSTPFNMSHEGQTSMDREDSHHRGDVVKQLEYDSENDNSLRQEEDDVFVEETSVHQENKLQRDSMAVSSNSSLSNCRLADGHVTLSNGNASSNDLSQNSSPSTKSEKMLDMVRRNRGNVVYHSSELQYCMTPQLEHVIQELEPQNRSSLEKRKAQIDQQVMMERRTKKKMQTFYKKLVQGGKPAKGDQKSMLNQVSKDIKDMTNRLKFMELAWGHVEMLLTELHGISPSVLHSLVSHLPDAPLVLSPHTDNPHLQFQVHHDSASSVHLRVLHAGTPDGLMSYLFTLSALADGYVHHFLYTFRYLATQHDLLDFFMDKYTAAKRHQGESLNEKVMMRALDLIYFWLEGYYTVDFEKDSELTDKLQEFIINEVVYPDGGGATLLGLLQDCSHGNNTELSFTGAVVTDEIDLQLRQDDSFSPKKLQGFKAIMKSSPSLKNCNPAIISTACLDQRPPPNSRAGDIYFPRVSRRTDAFTLTDYSAQSLAEQLCLIQQELFQSTHPVYYLNSKAQGISVAMALHGGPTPNSRNSSITEDLDTIDCGLYVEAVASDPTLQRMIILGQEISHWVAAEIVGCSSPKSQLAVLTKLIYAGQICMQMRNFASCVAISDGLENLIVRQLPIWKNLPSKCVAIKEELSSIKMLLKNEPMCLTQDKEFRDHPTIPSILLFLMHVQQLEIGGFRLANSMYKWPKLRSLAQMVDQVRMFKDQRYQCETVEDLQDTLQQRIHDLRGYDLQALAAQHDTNFHKVGSSRSIFRRMKGKFQSKGDKY